VLEDAERLIAAWDDRQTKRMPMLFGRAAWSAIERGRQSRAARLNQFLDFMMRWLQKLISCFVTAHGVNQFHS
jgi:hypothetical protein